MTKRKPSNCIIYQDANNLNRWAMSECLPTSKFELIVIDGFDLNGFSDDSTK